MGKSQKNYATNKATETRVTNEPSTPPVTSKLSVKILSNFPNARHLKKSNFVTAEWTEPAENKTYRKINFYAKARSRTSTPKSVGPLPNPPSRLSHSPTRAHLPLREPRSAWVTSAPPRRRGRGGQGREKGV